VCNYYLENFGSQLKAGMMANEGEAVGWQGGVLLPPFAKKRKVHDWFSEVTF
jgi:hypothetical protein